MTKREEIEDLGFENSVLYNESGFDDAIVGVSIDGNVVYDYEKMVRAVIKSDGLSEQDAIDWVEYNSIRSLAYVEGIKPIVINMLVEVIEDESKAN